MVKDTDSKQQLPDNPSAEFCPTCRKWFVSPDEKLHIRNTTMCFSCEHIEGENKYGQR